MAKKVVIKYGYKEDVMFNVFRAGAKLEYGYHSLQGRSGYESLQHIRNVIFGYYIGQSKTTVTVIIKQWQGPETSLKLVKTKPFQMVVGGVKG